jgi:hypothetical protein
LQAPESVQPPKNISWLTNFLDQENSKIAALELKLKQEKAERKKSRVVFMFTSNNVWT